MTPAPTFDDYQRKKREKAWKDKVASQKESMGNKERVERAYEWKSIGNDKFKSGNLPEAKDYYREAIFYVEDLVDARRQERVDLLMPLYCNLAQAYLKLQDAGAADEVANKAVMISEVVSNKVGVVMRAKALFRRGLARQLLERLDDARDDFSAAVQLQPKSDEISSHLSVVREELAVQSKKSREAIRGFLQRKTISERKQKEAMAEGRRERLARAQQRQQMQTVFKKLSEGDMLYEKREKEMEPVRKEEERKRQTFELEKTLTNIVHESKGVPATVQLDDFMDQKLARCKEQHTELERKKKVLVKRDKECQWEDDDRWKSERDDHRRQKQEERTLGLARPGPPTFWQSMEVARWCEQQLRALLVQTSVIGDDIDSGVVRDFMGETDVCVDCSGYLLRAMVIDVVKLVGDAAVLRLNPDKPPLHYFDYFIKIEWEVALSRKGENVYRTAEELITAAAFESDGKAPSSIVKHSVSAGSFKIREFCSEDLQDSLGADQFPWDMSVKIKRPYAEGAPTSLQRTSESVQAKLAVHVKQILTGWVEKYKNYGFELLQ